MRRHLIREGPPTALTLSHCPLNISDKKSKKKSKSSQKRNVQESSIHAKNIFNELWMYKRGYAIQRPAKSNSTKSSQVPVQIWKRLMIVWSWERENELLMPGRKERQKEVKCLLSSWETASLCHYCLCLFSLNLLFSEDIFSLVKLYCKTAIFCCFEFFPGPGPGKWIWKFLLGWRVVVVGMKAVLRFSLMAALKLDIFDGSHQAWYGFMRPRTASISTLLHNPRNLTKSDGFTSLSSFQRSTHTGSPRLWSGVKRGLDTMSRARQHMWRTSVLLTLEIRTASCSCGVRHHPCPPQSYPGSSVGA